MQYKKIKDMVILKTNRTYYNVKEAANDSITVREFIEHLEGNFNLDDKIVFSNDGGYTYGYINENTAKEV